MNVAVALSLAGIGPDQTTLEIWADPTVVRNTHMITVDADSASFTVSIQNIPSENPKTGRITALSVVAQGHDLVSSSLRGLASLQDLVGSSSTKFVSAKIDGEVLSARSILPSSQL